MTATVDLAKAFAVPHSACAWRALGRRIQPGAIGRQIAIGSTGVNYPTVFEYAQTEPLHVARSIPLVERYKPHTFAEFAGLDHPRAILTAFARSPYPSACPFAQTLRSTADAVVPWDVGILEQVKSALGNLPFTGGAIVTWDDIKGHAAAKRALEVAAAGHHSVLLVGPPGAGKDSLREAFTSLLRRVDANVEIANVEIALPCWCGYWQDVSHECACSAKAIGRYSRRLAARATTYDVVVDVPRVPTKELLGSRRGETEAEAAQRVLAARTFRNDHPGQGVGELDESGRRVLEMAASRLRLGVGEFAAVLRVSRTIADLAASVQIQTRHVAEAVQYRWRPRG